MTRPRSANVHKGQPGPGTAKPSVGDAIFGFLLLMTEADRWSHRSPPAALYCTGWCSCSLSQECEEEVPRLGLQLL